MRTLTARGETPVGLDILPSPYTHIVGSVSDPEVVAMAMDGVEQVYHTATLHKPHVVTHEKADFLNTNINGTLTLLEAAVAQNVSAFVFTSTTSVFGDALRPKAYEPAAWITEDTQPLVKNIYGATKLAAEDLCRLFHRNHGLNTLVLRTSRFFPEDDDDSSKQARFDEANLKANEFLYRRVELEDAVDAHLLAAEKAAAIGHGCYIISATSPFTLSDLKTLGTDAAAVVGEHFPDQPKIYRQLGYEMLPVLDRVYVNSAARVDLGWQPRWDFAYVLSKLAKGEEARSELAKAVGKKGYHSEVFGDGPYPVE